MTHLENNLVRYITMPHEYPEHKGFGEFILSVKSKKHHRSHLEELPTNGVVCSNTRFYYYTNGKEFVRYLKSGRILVDGFLNSDHIVLNYIDEDGYVECSYYMSETDIKITYYIGETFTEVDKLRIGKYFLSYFTVESFTTNCKQTIHNLVREYYSPLLPEEITDPGMREMVLYFTENRGASVEELYQKLLEVNPKIKFVEDGTVRKLRASLYHVVANDFIDIRNGVDMDKKNTRHIVEMELGKLNKQNRI